MKISEDTVVGLRYVIRNSRGDRIEETPPGHPWFYLHGAAACPPGLEAALLGQEKGATLAIEIEPEFAYGVRNDEAVIKLNRAELPENPIPEVGMLLTINDGQGDTDFRILEVTPNDITIDANHPLAGEKVCFEVEVVEVRLATSSELLAREARQPGEDPSPIT